jgi:hypothetical protein
MDRDFHLPGFAGFDLKKLRLYKEEITKFFEAELVSTTIVVFPLDTNDSKATLECERIVSHITSYLHAKTERVRLNQVSHSSPDNYFLLCLFITNMSPEDTKKEIARVLPYAGHESNQRPSRTQLNHLALFLPRTGVVACRSYDHGGGHYYRYRIATFKLNKLSKGVRDFLLSLQSYCPDQYFKTGPRASSFEASVEVHINHSIKHPLVDLAIEGLKVRKLKSAHEDLEKYLLEVDPDTVACEVPVWFEPSETARLRGVSSDSEGTMTGHIDVLRCGLDGGIEIWDYKPDAAVEKTAQVQVYLYALMLSTRSNLHLDQFTCGYFDSKDAYSFKPSSVSLEI